MVQTVSATLFQHLYLWGQKPSLNSPGKDQAFGVDFNLPSSWFSGPWGAYGGHSWAMGAALETIMQPGHCFASCSSFSNLFFFRAWKRSETTISPAHADSVTVLHRCPETPLHRQLAPTVVCLPRRHPVTLHVRSDAPCSVRSFLLLVAMPGAPSSVLVPSSTARSP